MFKLRLFSMQRSSTATRALLPAMFAVVFLLIAFLPLLALAQGADNDFGLSQIQDSGLGTASLVVIIANIIRVILGVIGVVLLVLILYAGFLWMTSSGDDEKIAKAKKIILRAVIGLIIMLSAFTIASFIIRSITGSFFPAFGGQPKTLGPGGLPSNWGLGAGPIESVLPYPNQINVPINTSIIVTFKEPILASTICNVAENTSGNASICDNEAVLPESVEICQLNDDKTECVADGEAFGASSFTGINGIKVIQLGDRTFIFSDKYLGADDGKLRWFRVTLKNNIHTQTNQPVFDNSRGSKYDWRFQTNGQMDLDPPEIVSGGVYPAADNQADTYSEVEPATKGSVTITASAVPLAEAPPKLQDQPFLGTKLTVDAQLISGSNPNNVKVRVITEGGFNVGNSGDVEVVISGTKATFSEAITGEKNINGSLVDTGTGIYLQATGGAFPQGSTWRFSVAEKQDGDKLVIADGRGNEHNFIFVKDDETRDSITIAGKSHVAVKIGSDISKTFDNLVKAINESSGKLVSATKYVTNNIPRVTVTAQQAGVSTMTLTTTAANLAVSGSLSGTAAVGGRTQHDKFDVYKNTIFKIDFNEAIHPAYLSQIKVFRDGTEVTGFQIEQSNQYRTIELRGPDQCGRNACGETRYCWPTNPLTTGQSANSTIYKIKIGAAELNYIEGTCNQWGGAADSAGRCAKTVGNTRVFYPQADLTATNIGLMDTAKNSFNGSFNTYVSGSDTFGVANGPVSYYNLNNSNPRYSASDPEVTGGLGDSFEWSFYVSSEMDTQAPLIKRITPVGNESLLGLRSPIELAFDRLMRSATLKPGWNYGSSEKEKSQRYLLVGGIAEGAYPVGYWISKTDSDTNGDGEGDKSIAHINHDAFARFAKYGSLAGSGIESLTQNCFLPVGGPKFAGDTVVGGVNDCGYSSAAANETNTTGCVRDSNLNTQQVRQQVKLPNPASFGHMTCQQMGANKCLTGQQCMVWYFNSEEPQSYLSGSWAITAETGYNSADTNGRTGCCFGTCVASNEPAWKTCADAGGTVGSSATNVCEQDEANADAKPGLWVITRGLDVNTQCCLGIMR